MARNGQGTGSQNHCVDSTRAVRGTCMLRENLHIHCTVQCMCRIPCHVHTRNRCRKKLSISGILLCVRFSQGRGLGRND